MPSPKRTQPPKKRPTKWSQPTAKHHPIYAERHAECEACGHAWKLRGAKPSRCPACDEKRLLIVVQAAEAKAS